jgi:hypothetical protein
MAFAREAAIDPTGHAGGIGPATTRSTGSSEGKK